MKILARYSSRAAPGLAYLKSIVNDLHVFVEDTASKKLWDTLISKHIPDGVKFNSVNLLGGKEAVIRAFESDHRTDDFRRIYIVDSDFDALRRKIVRGKRRTNGAILHSTLGYCIENHLLQEEAIVDVCGSMSPDKTDDEIKNRIDISGLLNNCDELLVDLFSAYAIARRISPDAKTVSISCKSYFIEEGNKVRYDKRKIREKIFNLKRNNSDKFGIKHKEKFLRIRETAKKYGARRVASGKDYIFPPLLINAQKNSGFKGDIEQLKLQIVRSAKYQCDGVLRRHIREALLPLEKR